VNRRRRKAGIVSMSRLPNDLSLPFSVSYAMHSGATPREYDKFYRISLRFHLNPLSTVAISIKICGGLD
jgi:hypothetical protein